MSFLDKERDGFQRERERERERERAGLMFGVWIVG